MLKRTGHWWSKRRIWFYSQNGGEQVAARPHPVSVRLGLLSPILALVATAISLVSLWTSRQSLEVGQRAYIRISKGSLVLSESNVQSDPRIINLRVGFDISNVGNTPAHFTWLKLRFDANQREWLGPHYQPIYKDGLYFLLKFDLAPRAELSQSMPIELHWSGLHVPDLDGGIEIVPTVYGRLDYVDVFGKSHEEAFCWAKIAKSIYTSDLSCNVEFLKE